MPVFGQSSGVRAAEALEAFDGGVDRQQELQRRARQAAIDTESLRGAGIRNDATQEAAIRLEELHPLNINRGELQNEGLAQGIQSNAMVLEAAREQARLERDAADLREQAYRTELEDTIDERLHDKRRRPAETDRMLAEDQAREAEAVIREVNAETNEAEARRLKKIAAETSGSRDRINQLDQLRLESEAEYKQIEAAEKSLEQGKQLPADRAKAKLSREVQSLYQVVERQRLKPNSVPAFLNDSPMYGISGVVRTEVDDQGVFRALDANGNVVVDYDDLDAQGNPTPFEFDVSMLSEKLLEEHMPATYAQLLKGPAKPADPQKAVNARNSQNDVIAEEVQKHMVATYDVKRDTNGDRLNLTPQQSREAQKIQAAAASYDHGTTPALMAIAYEKSHPKLVEQIVQLGVDAAQLEMDVNKALSDARSNNLDVTRLSLLEDLLIHLQNQSQAPAQPTPGR